MIEAAIFDLDGLLIDSEPMWRQAEMEILPALGVPLTEEMCRQTQGTRVDRAIQHWFDRFPWEGPSVEAVAGQTVERVVEIISESAQAMPGAHATIDFFIERKIPVALCSSSWSNLIRAALAKTGLAQKIPIGHSAEGETYGKPHPAAYLSTAAKLEVDPTSCLVFEDSFNGAIAGKAALMKVVAVPEPFLARGNQWGFCDAVLGSLEDFTAELFGKLSDP